MNFDLLLGTLGMLLILTAFILDEFFKKWNQNTIKYNLFNALGSILLVYYAYSLDSWPFMILNGIWFGVALYKLAIIKK